MSETNERLEAAFKEINQLEVENARIRKFSDDMWAECEARGEILDRIQKAAKATWWLGAIDKIAELEKLVAEQQEAIANLRSAMICEEVGDIPF